jgi:hypothetical protein
MLRAVTSIESGARVFLAGDIHARMRELSMWDDREGMLEGTPYLHRRLRVIQLDKLAATSAGLYIHGLEGIRADAAARVDSWLPGARVRARLTAGWRPAGVTGFGETTLSVEWFQQLADDPFARLAEIVRPLDWRSLACFEPDPD